MPLTKELCHWDDDVFLENCSTTVGTAEIWRFSVAATEWWTKPNPFIPNCNFIQARFFLEFFPLCFRFIFNVRNVLCGEQSRNAQTVAAAPQLRRDKKSGLRFVRAEKTESECKRNGRTKTFAADTLDAAFTSYSIAHGTGKKRSHRKWRRLPCITVLVNFYYIFILNDVKKERWNTHTQRQCHLIAAAKKCAKTGTNRKKNWCVCVWVLCAAFRIWFEAKCGREKSRKKWTKISLSVNASLWTNADKNWQLWNFKWNATKPAAADRQSQCE